MLVIADRYLVEMRKVPFDVNKAKLNEFVDRLEITNPRKSESGDNNYIAFDDRVLDLETFTLSKFSRNKIALLHLPFESKDRKMETPVFDEYLKTTFPDDEPLQEFIPTLIGSYLLSPDKIQAAFFLVGEGANGKSVLLDTISAIFGENYVSSFTLKSLTQDRFTVAELIGKKINIVNEDESKFLEGERFKALITGDKVQAERKYSTPFSFRPVCKFIFASNDAPTFKGVNHGLRRRIQIVPFSKIFTEEEQDKELTKKLKAELPGILGKALRAAKKLAENNFILETPYVMQKAKDEFIESCLPTLTFIRECCKITDPECYQEHSEMKEVYRSYRIWAKENGHQSSASKKFWDEIRRNEHDIMAEPRKSDGKRMINLEVTDLDYVYDESKDMPF